MAAEAKSTALSEEIIRYLSSVDGVVEVTNRLGFYPRLIGGTLAPFISSTHLAQLRRSARRRRCARPCRDTREPLQRFAGLIARGVAASAFARRGTQSYPLCCKSPTLSAAISRAADGRANRIAAAQTGDKVLQRCVENPAACNFEKTSFEPSSPPAASGSSRPPRAWSPAYCASSDHRLIVGRAETRPVS
jgi:hypothetical protein